MEFKSQNLILGKIISKHIILEILKGLDRRKIEVLLWSISHKSRVYLIRNKGIINNVSMIKYKLDLVNELSIDSIYNNYLEIEDNIGVKKLYYAYNQKNILLKIETAVMTSWLLSLLDKIRQRVIKIRRIEAY